MPPSRTKGSDENGEKPTTFFECPTENKKNKVSSRYMDSVGKEK